MERAEAINLLTNRIFGHAENTAESGQQFNRMIDRGREALLALGVEPKELSGKFDL